MTQSGSATVPEVPQTDSPGAEDLVASAWAAFWGFPQLLGREFGRAAIELHADLVGKVAYRTFPPYFQDSRPARPFNILRIGDTASSLTEIKPELLLYFARASDDWNVLHFSEAHAAGTRFKRPIAHGMLVGSFVSALLSKELPGAGTLYESQSFLFKAPVFIGDRITTRVTVTGLDAEKRRVTLSVEARNQDMVVVLGGEAVVRLMKPS